MPQPRLPATLGREHRSRPARSGGWLRRALSAVHLLAMAGGVTAIGGSPVLAQDPSLDAYVAEGLSRNLGLSAERLVLAGANAGVREANGRWLPSVTVNARYSELSGNVLDIGRLVNPAHGALNQLLGRPDFPTEVTLTQPFKRETGVRLIQPLFEPGVAAGVAIARSARDAQLAATAGAERRLAAQIRLAYLDHARATRVEELERATMVMLDENLRVVQSLLSNGAATPDALLRARADRSEGEQRLADAIRLRDASRAAFNLLLDRPLTGEVALVADSVLGLARQIGLDSALATGLSRREELRQLGAGVRVAEGRHRLTRASFLPSVNAALDYGFQGDRYEFNARSDYLIASLVFRWNIFNGGQDRARADQARWEAEALRATRADSHRQVELEIRTAWGAAEVARQSIVTAAERLASAERSYALVERRYREGAASQVELIEARTNFTAARLNLVLTSYDYYARCVELDRAAALYPAGPHGEESP